MSRLIPKTALCYGIGFLLMLGACGDNSFKANDASARAADAVPQQPEPLQIDNSVLPSVTTNLPSKPQTASVQVSNLDGEKVPAIQKNFRYGEPNPRVDYVFVVDNSVSMNPILQKIRAGFSMLVSQAGAFSPDSQIAVMSTMTGSAAANFNAVGAEIIPYTGIQFEPGFLSFVDQAAILNYRLQSPDFAAQWPLNGCTKKWFLPTDKDPMGNYCFMGATQTSAGRVGAEAGIHAFQQLLQKNKGKPIFRTDTRVNVIFVSDTHDPGVDDPDLLASIPTYAQLLVLAKTDNKTIKDLRFHAIAPEVACTTEDVYTKSYYKLAADSKGEKADVCTLTDYTGFLRKMIAKSQASEAIFPLDQVPASIVAVYVDGTKYTNYKLEGNKIKLEGLDPLKPVVIRVDYLPKKN